MRLLGMRSIICTKGETQAITTAMTILSSDCDDYVLLARAIDGDRYAFDKLAERYKPRLFAAAFRVTRNHEQAADAVTDALIRLFKTGNTFRFESKLSTWLHRVVVNCARDIARRALARPTRSLDSLLETQGEQDFHPIEPLDDSEDREEVMTVAHSRIIEELTLLPEPERDLLLAVHLYHTPYDHLANDLHIPVGTVKSRIFRARRMLKDRLPAYEQIEDDYETHRYTAMVA